jgi:CopA family copper-resistance protein
MDSVKEILFIIFFSLFFISNVFAREQVINLTVAYKTVYFAGKPGKAIAVNNQIPAPTLHFKEGDHVSINVYNNLDQDTAIHWHGMLVPWQMDGVEGLSQRGIPPGHTFHYQFTLHQSGTYWYHAHAGLQEQQGLYGAFLIDPPTPSHYKYTKDYTIVLSDWSNTDPNQILSNLKKEGDYYSPRFPLQPSLMKFIHDYQKASPEERKNIIDDYKMMQQMRMSIYDFSDVAYDAFLLNGKPKSSAWTAQVKVGDIVRLRFIGAGGSTIFNVKIPGTSMQMVHVEGNDVKPYTINEFKIAPGETYDVLVKIKKNEPYIIYAESIDTLGAAYGALITSPNQYVNYNQVTPFPGPKPVMRDMMALMMGDHGSSSMNMSMDMSSMNENKSQNHSMSTMSHSMKKQSSKAMSMESSSHSMTSMKMSNHKQHSISDSMKMDPNMKMDDNKSMDHSMSMNNSQESAQPEKANSKNNSEHQSMSDSMKMDPNMKMDDNMLMDHSMSMNHSQKANQPKQSKNKNAETHPGMPNGMKLKPGMKMPTKMTMPHSMKINSTDSHQMDSMIDMSSHANHAGMSGMNMGSGMKMAPGMSMDKSMNMDMPTESSIVGDSISQPDGFQKTVGTKYQDLVAAVKTNDPNKPVDGVIKMELFGYMDRYIWFINGEPEYKAHPIVLEPNKRYRFVFTNTSMMRHPMHIHGHWFILRNGHGVYDPLLHTLDIPPGATVTADVDTDASGQWFFHCHLLYHMMTGMSRTFQYSTLIDITRGEEKPQNIAKDTRYFNRPIVRVDEVRPIDAALVKHPMVHPPGLWLATFLDIGEDPFHNVQRLTYKGLYGPDYNKLELFTNDAEVKKGTVENADIDIFYWHLISQFWAVKGGVNYFYRPANTPYWQPGVGIEGLIPYFIDINIRGYTYSGSAKLDAEFSRDTQITNNFFIRAGVRGILASKTITQAEIGSGLNQMRYIIRPFYRLMPGLNVYAEYEHEQDYGAFKNLQRNDGESSVENTLTFGLSLLF